MDPLALSIALGAGLTVVLATYGGVTARAGGRTRVQDRLSGAVGGQTRRAVPVVEESILRDRASGGGLLERLLSRSDRSSQTLRMLERANLPLRPSEYLMVRLVASAVGVVLGALLGNVAGAGSLSVLFYGGGAVAGFMAPAFYARRRISSRAQLIEGQIVEMTDLMASSLSAGFGYMQALISISQQLDPPLSDEMVKMVDDVNLGGDIDEALQALNERLDSKDFDIVTTAITIQRTAGGNLAEILRGVALTVRARQSFKREVAALTSKERFSAMIIAGFPLVLVGGLALMVPEMYGRLFTDTVGRIALGVALGLDTLSYFVIKGMTNIEA